MGVIRLQTVLVCLGGMCVFICVLWESMGVQLVSSVMFGICHLRQTHSYNSSTCAAVFDLIVCE